MGQSRPNMVSAMVNGTLVRTRCAGARPIRSRRLSRSSRRETCRPISNSRNTTPSSARRCVVELSSISPKTCGPMRMPTARYPTMGESLSAFEARAAAPPAARSVMAGMSASTGAVAASAMAVLLRGLYWLVVRRKKGRRFDWKRRPCPEAAMHPKVHVRQIRSSLRPRANG